MPHPRRSHCAGRAFAAALAVALAAGAAGCAAGPRLFVNRDADMSLYRKIAVVPFANLTADAWAGERVTRAFITELVIAERFRIVEPGEFRIALDRIGAAPDARGDVDPAKLTAAAAPFDVTGILRGAVTEYQMRRSGSEETPVVGFEVELLDVATKNVVWRVAVTKKGRGRLPILGGGAGRTYGRVTQEACEEVVRLLQRRAF